MNMHVTRFRFWAAIATTLLVTAVVFRTPVMAREAGTFDGRFYSGQGDVEYLRLLDISRRMFSVDPDC